MVSQTTALGKSYIFRGPPSVAFLRLFLSLGVLASGLLGFVDTEFRLLGVSVSGLTCYLWLGRSRLL